MKKHKAGDVVQLKSGGPKMTVEGYDMLGQVICKWFLISEVKVSTFDEDALEPAKG